MRVGTSIYADTDSIHCEDHPHACGDKIIGSMHLDGISGSSPCVWGQVCYNTIVNRFDRIIPMRVGTSGYAVNRCKVPKDHPHACGDKLDKNFVLSHMPGSSPCVWGQGFLQMLEVFCCGIIPMRVGTSTMVSTML